MDGAEVVVAVAVGVVVVDIRMVIVLAWVYGEC